MPPATMCWWLRHSGSARPAAPPICACASAAMSSCWCCRRRRRRRHRGRRPAHPQPRQRTDDLPGRHHQPRRQRRHRRLSCRRRQCRGSHGPCRPRALCGQAPGRRRGLVLLRGARQELEHRKQLEQDLRAAIANDGFTVFFQPQVALTDGAITGVEALARWSQPSRGPIAPAEFIPAAEKAGLMVPIGRIIVRKAIAQAAQWHRESVPFGRIAINVSSAEIRESDFAAFLFETLAAAGLPAERVSLEIIESVILDDEKTGIAERLRLIRAAGVHLELDDFGTGYASLSHVNPNEIDRLKIDRRFVQNIDGNGDNTKIVRAITELARGLGISIIAEGAETEAELDALLSIGCQEVQGFSIAFPMPGAQASAWLTTHAKSVRQQPSTKAGSSV